MLSSQPGILADVPSHSRYLEFNLIPDRDPHPGLEALAVQRIDETVVIGVGPALVARLGQRINGLRTFPSLSGPGCSVPSTQADLWIWIRGTDRGHIALRSRALKHAVAAGFRCARAVDGFMFDRGLDLSGYEDGTENPQGEAAVSAAIVAGAGAPLDGSSFVSVQQWVHDLDHFGHLSQAVRDDIIGRRIADNEEIADASASAHVKRAAQESFDPEAFILRRSMPWADGSGEGLVFVAFGTSLYAFEAILRRMMGQEDGVVDGLFRFTRPISGSHFWCPPVENGKLALGALGL